MARYVKWSLASRTSDPDFVYIFHACYMSYVSHPPPFYLPNSDDIKLFYQHAASLCSAVKLGYQVSQPCENQNYVCGIVYFGY